jgi:hypothetical protein
MSRLEVFGFFQIQRISNEHTTHILFTFLNYFRYLGET